MQLEEFTLVRDLYRDYASRFRAGSATVEPSARTAAQKALQELDLAELRRTSPPAATVQECALLAEEHGRQPMTASFLGTALLAPELLRLLRAVEPVDCGALPTIALHTSLRFPGLEPTELCGWDCDGTEVALCVAADGTVSSVGLGSPSRTVDLLRSVRSIPAGFTRTRIGRLDPAQLAQWQAFALVMVAGELTGAADSLVRRSVDYARDRSQYGRPIGSFQAVQHLLAEAAVLVEACVSATRYAAWCLDHASPAEALTAARVAKAEANVSAVEAVKNASQVFGGIAQTWEHDAHLYLRKVLTGAITLATTADLLVSLATADPGRP